MTIHSHRELIVWQKAVQLIPVIYQITEHFPYSEANALTDQMRRASTSIALNIAEGRRRGSRKDFCRFLRFSFASGSELETQIEITKQLPFGRTLDFSKADSLLLEVMKMLNVMIRKLQQKPEAKKLRATS